MRKIIKNKKEDKVKKVDKKVNKKITKSVFGLSEVITLVVITMLISLLMGIGLTYCLMSKNTNYKTDKEVKEFIKNYNYITDNYYVDVNKKELLDGAIRGMVETLGDKHSSYIDNKKTNNFDITLQGSYEGVGLEVVNDDAKNIIVLRVFPNSAASEAGIKSGDKIISVDGKNLVGKSTTEFASYIKSKEGSKDFNIIYERDSKQIEVILKKKYVIITSVMSKVYEQENKKIGYMNVSLFSATTYNQFKKELADLEKQNIDSLVIDLRANSGGHLSVVEDMLSLFMDKEHVIYQIQTKNNTKKYYSKGNTDKKYKIIVLQDNGSASASELMASSLQEQLNAIIVGKTSYGKGTVQELVNLKDGNQYKFTTKKWLTSKGAWINDIGVKPNVEVDLNDKYFETGSVADDNQLQTALSEAIK